MRPRLTPPFIIAMAFFAVLFLVIMTASAQVLTCNSTEICLRWTAVTQYEDNTPIAAGTVVSYTVYVNAEGEQQLTKYAVTPALALKVVSRPRGNNCAKVTATVAGRAESVFSNTACKVVRFPGPTDGKIESPSDGAIEDSKPQR